MRRLLFLLFSLISIYTHAQGTIYHTEDKRAQRYYEEARQYLKRTQFREAIEPIQDALDRDPEFIEAWLGMGTVNYRLHRDSLTIYCFGRALEIDPDYQKSIYAYFIIGELHFKKTSYDEAQKYLEHYLSVEGTDARRSEQAREMVYNCRFALAAMKNPFDYNIKVLPDHANHFKLQYFPVWSVDRKKIYFTRREGLNYRQDEDIYYADLNENGEWSIPQSISENINSEFNEGAASLSADGRMLVFTSCDGRRGYGSCDIYASYKEGENWSVPENMGRMINSVAWEAQPSLSADGRTMYFVSNRQGGFGQKDIWRSSKNKKGEWEMAVNIGKKVNTNKDDISPFIHANGETIYFSSNGYEGLGGLDIYMSELKDSVWSEPNNLGYPLNDAHDQVSLYIASNGKNGCYTIEKRSGGDLESKLYSFDLPDSFQVTNKSSYLKGRVADVETGTPLQAKIKVYKLNDEHFYSLIETDKVNGSYTIVLTENNEYGVYVTSKGYMFKDFSFSFEDVDQFDVNLLDIRLQPIKVGTKIVLGNIFFEFDEFSLKRKSSSELKIAYDFLRKNPKVKVEISGHTDNTGSAQYNMELSTKRAKSVYDFLVFKRIKKGQLFYKGYGQTDPIASNENLDGQVKNRRIEFKIAEILSE